MLKLDHLDRRLLYELDGNSRQSASELSRKLREGRDRVEYRLTRLMREGIIKRCAAVLNPYRLGITNYKSYLKLERNRRRYHEIITYLSRHPNVYWLAECDGRWDLMFSVLARTPFDFHLVQDEILNRFNDLVIAFDLFTIVNSWYYTKQYFIAGRGKQLADRPYYFLGGVPAMVSVDALETKLLHLLASDSRLSNVELAERSGTTAAVVKSRIARLEEAGVILGYRIEVDLERLQMSFFKAQLYLRSYELSELSRLKSYCASQPSITYHVEQLGTCKLEVEIEVNDYPQYNRVIDQLAESFPKLIRNVETTHIRREGFKWIPGARS